MTEAQREARTALASLRRSVRKALEHKRKLGQYAVVWQDGRCVRKRADDLASPAARRDDKDAAA